MFQVPKGMLQTSVNRSSGTLAMTRVSSPQGNATNKITTIRLQKFCKSVSSPQGNATNYIELLLLLLLLLRFKSPRECYKQHLLLANLRKTLTVSSPQGNATNKLQCSLIYSRHCVSSPQGNATNFLPILSSFVENTGVSSPQGNATNNSILVWKTVLLTEFQVPKGMLQTISKSLKE